MQILVYLALTNILQFCLRRHFRQCGTTTPRKSGPLRGPLFFFVIVFGLIVTKRNKKVQPL